MHRAGVAAEVVDAALLHVVEIECELALAERGDVAGANQLGVEFGEGEAGDEIELRDVGHGCQCWKSVLVVGAGRWCWSLVLVVGARRQCW